MSMDQPSMFDDDSLEPIPTRRPCRCCGGSGWIQSADPIPSAPARPTDPETSHDASPISPDLRRFSSRSRQAQLLLYLSEHPDTAQGAAIGILGAEAISSIEGCRRRVSDLRAAGHLIDSGDRGINPGSNDESIIWAVSEEGLRAIDRLRETGWSL